MIRYIPHLIAAGALVATVYAVYTAGHNAGHGAGYQDGHTRGADEAYRIADANALSLLADSRAEAEKALREANESRQAEESRLAAEIDSARTQAAADLESVRNQRDRLAARLRVVQTGGAVRPADSSGGVPATTEAIPAGAFPTGALLAAIGRNIERASDAEQLNVWYGQCLRAYNSLRNEDVVSARL